MAQFSDLKNRDFINVYNDFFLKVYSWNYQVFAKIMTEVLLGILFYLTEIFLSFPGGSVVKNLLANARLVRSISGLG